MNNHVGLAAIVCLGTIYAAYTLGFYPTYVTTAALGFLAYAAFSQSSPKRPPLSSQSYLND